MRSGYSPQGLRYAVRRSGRAVAYCALTIGVGTRHEAGYPAGIAHFVEHTMFRGTQRKSAAVISGYLDRLGGELNAYTTKEEIVLHATVLKEDWRKAARLLFELATQATFPAGEIETERGVVLDEIISYKDNPAEDVYDRFETLLFDGHPLSTPILGTASSVKKITPEMLRRFVQEKFVPSSMVLTVVADIDEKELEKQALRLIAGVQAFFAAKTKADAAKNTCTPAKNVRPDTSDVQCASTPAGEECPFPSIGLFLAREWASSPAEAVPGRPLPMGASAFILAPGGKGLSGASPTVEAVSFHKVIDKRHHEVNAVVGGLAPSLYEMPQRLVCAMLANILGGPASNSLLNKELREKRGWVYGIECSYTQYADTGILAITFGCDKPNLDACLRAIGRILDGLREKPFTPRQLAAYRKQLLGQLAIGADAGEAQCLSMGKSMLSWGSIMTADETRAALQAITPADLQAMARRLFDPSALSSLVYL